MGRRLSDEEMELRRRLWRDHAVSEIAAMTGMSRHAVNAFGMRHFGGFAGHGEEARKRTIAAMQDNVKYAHTAEAQKKHKDNIRELRRKERLRERWGLPPKTRWPRKLMPRAAYYARYGLARNFGYFYFDDEPFTLWYDKDTRRCRKIRPNTGEEYFARKYGFKFKEAEEEDNA